MRRAEPSQLPPVAHALDAGEQPQRHQQARIRGRPAGVRARRFEWGVKGRQVQPAGQLPDRANGVIRRQPFVQTHGFQQDLPPIRPAHPWLGLPRAAGIRSLLWKLHPRKKRRRVHAPLHTRRVKGVLCPNSKGPTVVAARGETPGRRPRRIVPSPRGGGGHHRPCGPPSSAPDRGGQENHIVPSTGSVPACAGTSGVATAYCPLGAKTGPA